MAQSFAISLLIASTLVVSAPAYSKSAKKPQARKPASSAVSVPFVSEQKTSFQLAKLFFAARAAIGERKEFTDDPTNSKLDKGTLLDSIRIAYERLAAQPLDVETEPRMKLLWQAINIVLDKAMRGDFKGRWADHPNYPGLLIPARFGSEVTHQFNALTKSSALRWTTSDEYLVNPTNKADEWETKAIAEKFKSPTWTQGEPYFETISAGSQPAMFRYAMPEYFKTACMGCHGGEMGKKMHRGKGAPGAGTFGGILSVQLTQ